MNVLITSASAKLSLITAFQCICNDRGIKLFTVDSNPNCKASEVAEHFTAIPADDDPAYKAALLNICEVNKVGLIIPTRDSELIKLASMKQEFTQRGIHIPLPSAEKLKTVQNKKLFNEYCTQKGFSVLPLIEPAMNAPWPLFVRSIHGAGGAHAKSIETWRDWQNSHLSSSDVICQPVCADDEYSIDVLMDMSANPLQAVVRKRVRVADGECVEGIIVNHPEMEKKSLELCAALGLRGHNIVQAFCNIKDDIHFIEINSSFGGASMMSVDAGLKSPERLVAMCMGRGDKPENNSEIKFGVTYRRNQHSPECYDEVVSC